MEIKVFASGSSGNAYLVSDEKTTLLLDAGIPLREIQVACGFKVRMIDGCLITHSHKDHSKAAEGLARLGVDNLHQPRHNRRVQAHRTPDKHG